MKTQTYYLDKNSEVVRYERWDIAGKGSCCVGWIRSCEDVVWVDQREAYEVSPLTHKG